MYRLLLFLCLATVAYSCCAPQYFTANSLIRTYYNGSFYKGFGKVYYDYSAGIYSAFTNMSVDADHHIYSLSSTHVDITKGVVYFMTDGYCIKNKLTASWISKDQLPHCIPTAAHKAGTFSVGGPHEEVEVTEYQHLVMGGLREITVSKHYCYPLQEIFYTQTKEQQGHNQRVASMTQLVNIEEFIEDPTVFEIPDICFKSSYTQEPPTEENVRSLGMMSHYF